MKAEVQLSLTLPCTYGVAVVCGTSGRDLWRLSTITTPYISCCTAGPSPVARHWPGPRCGAGVNQPRCFMERTSRRDQHTPAVVSLSSSISINLVDSPLVCRQNHTCRRYHEMFPMLFNGPVPGRCRVWCLRSRIQSRSMSQHWPILVRRVLQCSMRRRCLWHQVCFAKYTYSAAMTVAPLSSVAT